MRARTLGLLWLAFAACFTDSGLNTAGEGTAGSTAGPGATTGDATSAGTSGTASTTGTTSTTGTASVTDGSTSDGSAGSSTGAPPDVAALCGMAFGTWMVGPIEHLPINSPASEIDPVLVPDGLTLLFSNSTVSLRAVRSGPSDPFDAPVANSDIGLDTSGVEIRVVFTADLLTAFIGATAEGGLGASDVWRMTRNSALAPFGGLTNVQPLNSALDDFDHQLSADGLRMYIAPVIDAQTKQQVLMVATRASLDQEFSPPAPIPELAGTYSDGSPAFPADERTLFFASMRTGNGDIYVSVRAGLDAPFSEPVPLTEINDPAQFDGEPFLSADGCELFFASGRAGGLGKWDIYRAPIVARP